MSAGPGRSPGKGRLLNKRSANGQWPLNQGFLHMGVAKCKCHQAGKPEPLQTNSQGLVQRGEARRGGL